MPSIVGTPASGSTGFGTAHNIALGFTSNANNVILVGILVEGGSPTTFTPSGALVKDYTSTLNTFGPLRIYFRYYGSSISTLPTITTDSGAILSWIAIEVSGINNASPTITEAEDSDYDTSHSFNFTTATANKFGLVAASYGGTALLTGLQAGWSGQAWRQGHGFYTNNDLGAAGTELFTSTGDGGGGRAQYVAFEWAANSSATVTGIPAANANEGSPVVHTVTLSGATVGTANFAASIANGTATSANYNTSLAAATYSNGVTFSGGNMVVPNAVSSWTVSIPTLDDGLYNDNLTYTLTVGGVSSVGTVNNTTPIPTHTVSSPASVSRGSPAIFTITQSAIAGKNIQYTFTTVNGTAIAGVDYTTSSGTATILAGQTTTTTTVTTLP